MCGGKPDYGYSPLRGHPAHVNKCKMLCVYLLYFYPTFLPIRGDPKWLVKDPFISLTLVQENLPEGLYPMGLTSDYVFMRLTLLMFTVCCRDIIVAPKRTRHTAKE